ncbi:acid sphingomyelinase [Aspergillus sclerotioniger CBS 115572]|uniref:Sphingomyelin phosphodiesterase n=1 Tax=Aspergillus sclerotioniger CBS 115572 TaxID=1450535 RepID=A0A317WZG6_9EURO|nr:acid sphingomyelinase [Aspergillus sclerotioniger CBS 115572]PWY91733.1 acid sphingomyelinase [Aspergillus sclerotioniger CBS 115572]
MRVSQLLCFGGLLGVALASTETRITKRETVSEILTDIEDATTCAACEALLVVLQALAHLGNDDFVDVITEVCILAGVDDDDVCKGAIGLEGPILAHDLRNMDVPSKTAVLFCTTIFGLCNYPAVAEYSVEFPSAKPVNASRPAPSGETPLQIVHISDIHVDLSYETGASYNCTKPICCRPYTTSDDPDVTDYPAGEYGNHNCDAPLTLEESMYAAIKELVPDSSFVIFTGDVVEGAVWLVNETEVTNDLNDAYNTRMSDYFDLVYGVTGNHDTAPVNSFPPSDIDTTISSQWAYDTLSSDWSQWIGSSAASTADDYGAYSVKYPGGNLRIISFNSNFYYRENFWLYEKSMQTDPNGQLAWLVSELAAAETAGERVWLMGHMPMGSGDTFHDASNYFNQIIQRYDATIAAVFYGHTHKDEFELAYSNYTDQSADTATMMSYIMPAMTPTSGNPAFRVYSVDPVTFGVLDFTEYITNMSSPTYQEKPTWEKYYSAKEAYGSLLDPPVTDSAAELTPAFWHNVTVLLENDDSVFQDYYARKRRGWDVSECTGDCKTDEICQLRAAESQYNCVEITPGINFKKRDTTTATVFKESACGESVVGQMFSNFDGAVAALQKAAATKLGSSFLNTTVNSTAA